jgi:organic hydroperoxide reductase OsmC/OhrA
VVDYSDSASGTLRTEGTGGRMTEVVLRPVVTVAAPEMAATCAQLHERAHADCFIASSVDFPVRHEPTVRVADRTP